MFSDFFSPTFVFLGGTIATLSVNKELDNLAMRRLEAFTWGSSLFAAMGVLIGAISILANLDEPKKLGPAIAFALLTLFWATVFNYLCKLIIENKKVNERPSPQQLPNLQRTTKFSSAHCDGPVAKKGNKSHRAHSLLNDIHRVVPTSAVF